MEKNGKMNYLTPMLSVAYVMKDVIVTSGPQEVGAEWTWGEIDE